jgi:glc operon protein GlcG
MRVPHSVAALFVAALLLTASAHAQQPAAPATPPAPPMPYGMSIDLATAKKLADAALAKAKFPSAVAIVGTGGEVVVLEKQDNSNYSVSELAVKKARSAAAFRRPTKFFEDALATRPAVGQLGVTAVGGGIPLVKDGHIIGAIGASGAPSSDGDIEAAQGGVDALK